SSEAVSVRARGIWEKTTGRAPTDEEWAKVQAATEQAREQLQRQMEAAEILEAHKLAQQTKEEARRLEDAKRGGTMEFLRGLGKSPARLPKLVANADEFAIHFARKAEGPLVNPGALKNGETIPDGAVIEYSAGVHDLGTNRVFPRSGPVAKDLLFVGLGMDQTLLRIEEISAREEIASLTFRDLTLDCNNDYMTDLRHEGPATIRFERCRIIGFDMGAGGSVMFAARTGAFYASDCWFEAGYSRTRAGYGNLFRVGSGLLVRMERCTFVGPFNSIYAANPAATYHFAECEIRDTKQHLARCKTNVRDGVTFENCVLTELAGDTRNIRRSHSDLNPAWPKRKP
ncbi:MAG: hypothetical protein ACYS0F_13165, partial [Planctomycetota bacterium]